MPPASGRMAPSSAYVSAPKKERSPPTIQTLNDAIGLVPVLARTRPGTRKIPEPMTMPIAASARSAVPRRRGSGAAGAGDVAVVVIARQLGTLRGIPQWYPFTRTEHSRTASGDHFDDGNGGEQSALCERCGCART